MENDFWVGAIILIALIAIPLSCSNRQSSKIEQLQDEVQELRDENSQLEDENDNHVVVSESDAWNLYWEEKERADFYASILDELQDELGDEFPEEYAGEYSSEDNFQSHFYN